MSQMRVFPILATFEGENCGITGFYGVKNEIVAVVIWGDGLMEEIAVNNPGLKILPRLFEDLFRLSLRGIKLANKPIP